MGAPVSCYWGLLDFDLEINDWWLGRNENYLDGADLVEQLDELLKTLAHRGFDLGLLKYAS
jgi:hypothetical protein